MNILVRNLSRKTTEAELRELFKPFGEIASCELVLDERTGESKGFGFVSMPETKAAKQAISRLNGKMVQGAKIRVKITNSQKRF